MNADGISGAFIRRRPTVVSKLPSGRRRRKVIGSKSRIQSEKCLGSLPFEASAGWANRPGSMKSVHISES